MFIINIINIGWIKGMLEARAAARRRIKGMNHRSRQLCTYKNKLPGPTITAKRCTQIPNHRRKILCIDYRMPLCIPISTHRSDTPSSTCKFITPPVQSPNPTLRRGCKGYAILNLCRILSAYRILFVSISVR